MRADRLSGGLVVMMAVMGAEGVGVMGVAVVVVGLRVVTKASGGGECTCGFGENEKLVVMMGVVPGVVKAHGAECSCG